MSNQRHFSPYLIDYVKKTCNLADFLEEEIGCKLNWYEPGVSAGTPCPMPNHKDTKPSFRIKYVEEDKLWIFHCLGCNVKGTIIDFFMDYYELNSLAEAIHAICSKFNIVDSADLETESLKDVKKTINIQKKMEHANIGASNQCRMLLRKDYNRYNKWVADTYKRLNIALDNKDIETIEDIGYEVSNKMGEK